MRIFLPRPVVFVLTRSTVRPAESYRILAGGMWTVSLYLEQVHSFTSLNHGEASHVVRRHGVAHDLLQSPDDDHGDERCLPPLFRTRLRQLEVDLLEDVLDDGAAVDPVRLVQLCCVLHEEESFVGARRHARPAWLRRPRLQVEGELLSLGGPWLPERLHHPASDLLPNLGVLPQGARASPLPETAGDEGLASQTDLSCHRHPSLRHDAPQHVQPALALSLLGLLLLVLHIPDLVQALAEPGRPLRSLRFPDLRDVSCHLLVPLRISLPLPPSANFF